MDKVEGLLMSPLEFSGFNVAETCNKMVDRNNWIMLKPREKIGNIKTFPVKGSYGMGYQWGKYRR